MKNTIKVGIAGLGTVGGALAKILIERKREVSRNGAGNTFELVAVANPCEESLNEFAELGIDTYRDGVDLAKRGDLDVVAELIGGNGVANRVAVEALNNGAHFVTANKKMLAESGEELFGLAADKKKYLGFGGAVCGGVPVILALRRAFLGNRYSKVEGVLNGTCNYILTQMGTHNISFTEAVRNAQKLGYAEEDPSVDVDGIDTAHKLTILSWLAFGRPFSTEDIAIKGIRDISLNEIQNAKASGGELRLVARAELLDDKITATVTPEVVKQNAPMGIITDALNAVTLYGDLSEPMTFIGAGAGAMPTALTVMSDIIATAADDAAHLTKAVADVFAKTAEVSYAKLA